MSRSIGAVIGSGWVLTRIFYFAVAGFFSTEGCPTGWVESGVPGGCSPGNFTLQTGFDDVDRAVYHCLFGEECNAMIESIKVLGGSCETDGLGTTCDVSPLIDENE